MQPPTPPPNPNSPGPTPPPPPNPYQTGTPYPAAQHVPPAVYAPPPGQPPYPQYPPGQYPQGQYPQGPYPPQYQQPWPQQPSGAQVAASQAAAAFKKHGRTFWDEARLCAQRVFRSDFQTEHATDLERSKLAAAKQPITNPMVQDFVAWRRAVLWIAAALIALHAVAELLSFRTFNAKMRPQLGRLYDQAERSNPGQIPLSRDEFIRMSLEQFGRDNAVLIDVIDVITMLSVFLGSAFVVLAARSWKSVRASRRWSRVGWAFLFVTPFLISALPITSLMSFDHITDPTIRQQQKTAVGAAYAMLVFMTIAPKAIALFPGLIRSSISLKTLVPESATPGWIATSMAPLYAIFLLTLVSVVNQAQGDLLLIGGVACYMIGPLVFLLSARHLIRPHSSAETSAIIGRVRRLSGIFTAIGTVLVAIFVMRMPHLSFGDAIAFLIGVGGNLLLMTVVASDLILALLYQGYRQARAFAGTDLEASLDQRFAALSEVGFTRLITTDLNALVAKAQAQIQPAATPMPGLLPQPHSPPPSAPR